MGNRDNYIKKQIDEYNKNPNLCKFCNQPILAPYGKRLSDTKIKKFCSQSCAAKFNNAGVVHNRHGAKTILDQFNDQDIVDAFYSSNSMIEFSKKLGYKRKMDFDNHAIKSRLQALNLNVEDLKSAVDISSLTKDQLFDRYEQWQTSRTAIAKMARQIFANSDKPRQCVVCGYNKHYEVAHIKAVSDFGGDSLISEINHIDNLIALCPNHHWEYDNGLLNISDHTSVTYGPEVYQNKI